MSSLPASIKRIGSKTTKERWRHHFPHYKSMGAFCCHGNQSFDPICPKTLDSLSPTQVMLHIKFDQDWPPGFRDIQVWKCGRRTDDGPLVYYKLTLWAFGSGELKTKTLRKDGCENSISHHKPSLLGVWKQSSSKTTYSKILFLYLFLCFQPFYWTTLKKRKNHKMQENCTEQDLNQGPLDCQSCILPREDNPILKTKDYLK